MIEDIARKRNDIISRMIRFLQKTYMENSQSKYTIVQHEIIPNNYVLESVMRKSKRCKNKILSTEQINQDIVVSFKDGLSNINSKKFNCFQDIWGVTKINLFINGVETFVLWAKFTLNFSSQNSKVFNFFVGNYTDLQFINKLVKRHNISKSKLSVGIYRVKATSFGINSEKIIKFPNIVDIFNDSHSSFKMLRLSINQYFESKNFIYGNILNIKRFLLYGPKGTGKTTALMQLANQYKNTHFIVICTDIASVRWAVGKAIEIKKPFIVIFEEIDVAANKLLFDKAAIKNFLSGSDMPYSKDFQGGIFAFTTNDPKAVDKTILQRRTGLPLLFDKNYINENNDINTDFIKILKKTIIDKNIDKIVSVDDLFQSLIANDIEKLSYDEINDIVDYVIIELCYRQHDKKVPLKILSSIIKNFKKSITDVNQFKTEIENDDL